MSISDILPSGRAQPLSAFAPPRAAPPLHGGVGVNDSVFFAILPPVNTSPRIARLGRDLREKHGLTGEPVRPRCFHISLLFVGFYGRLSREMLLAFITAASTVAMPPFRIALDTVTSFRHPQQRPLVLGGDDGVTGLIWLRDKLVAATLDIPGFLPNTRNFTPHLTLLRDPRKIDDEPIEPIIWTASEFVLIRSIHGEGRHVVLARWKLRG
jgi:RNA 2',3'-cyclic 3'-phosphodiesterase